MIKRQQRRKQDKKEDPSFDQQPHRAKGQVQSKVRVLLCIILGDVINARYITFLPHECHQVLLVGRPFWRYRKGGEGASNLLCSNS